MSLASAFGIIQQHDGWIDFESQHTIGTKFSIYLPYVDSTIQPHETCNLLKSKIGNELILLIDDEEMILDLCKVILREYGYRVLTATDGQKAWELIQKKGNEIVLIIVDLSMPRLSGKELIHKLKSMESTIRILVCTGHTDGYDYDHLLQLGASDVLMKPYQPNQLIEKIQSILESS